MGSLYLISETNGKPVVVGYNDSTGFWEWAPITGHFHQAPWWLHDMDGPAPESDYQSITADEARQHMDAGLGKRGSRFDERYQTEKNDKRSVPADTFLASAAPLRVDNRQSGPLRLADQARRADGEWVTYKEYPGSKRDNAYALANQIRSGRVQAVPAGEFTAVATPATTDDHGSYVVLIRTVAEPENI